MYINLQSYVYHAMKYHADKDRSTDEDAQGTQETTEGKDETLGEGTIQVLEGKSDGNETGEHGTEETLENTEITAIMDAEVEETTNLEK